MKKINIKPIYVVAVSVLVIVLFLSTILLIYAKYDFRSHGGGESIYIVGNPSLFPYEYYDENDDVYKGIIPDAWQIISENTGLSFVYISPGSDDQRSRIAKNNQAQIVSVFLQGEEVSKYITESIPISTVIMSESDPIEIRVGFTECASSSLKSVIAEEYGKFSYNDSKSVLESSFSDYERALVIIGLSKVTIWISAILIILGISGVIWAIFVGRKNRYICFHDIQTGIENREMFFKRIEKQIPLQIQNLYTVVYFSFDLTKIEDYIGRDNGKLIVIEWAKSLSEEFRDKEFFCYTDKGVFAICCCDLSEELLTKRIEALLEKWNKFILNVISDNNAGKTCIGLAKISPFEDINPQKCYEDAWKAYRYAKINNQPYMFYSQEIDEISKAEINLNNAITKNDINNDLSLYYQFIIEKETRRIAIVEALSKYNAGRRGNIPYGGFYKFLKSDEQIIRLDFINLEKVCSQLQSWKGTEFSKLAITCNLNRASFCIEDFPLKLKSIIEKYSFDHSLMMIELVEIGDIWHEERFRNSIRECKKLGFSILLDDLGAGNSSFADFFMCDFDYVKIDSQMVRRANEPEINKKIVQIVDLVHKLGAKVICEGIETTEIENSIANVDYDYAQGYLYSYVYPASELLESYRYLTATRGNPEIIEKEGACR